MMNFVMIYTSQVLTVDLNILYLVDDEIHLIIYTTFDLRNSKRVFIQLILQKQVSICLEELRLHLIIKKVCNFCVCVMSFFRIYSHRCKQFKKWPIRIAIVFIVLD
jgi:hypothetical protein